MDTVASSEGTTYDEVPYPAVPQPETHPARLATMAALFGMQPADPAQCRVLELGCADGGNLIPMAQAYPESEFIGIDLSARQVADGTVVLRTLGLQNITLAHLDIMALTAERYGTFDYIIVYGVYSWVPEPVRDRIMEFCRECLNPQGVAYISYNTLPGWHGRAGVREMILYHNQKQQVDSLAEGAREGRKLLQFVSDAVEQMNSRRPTSSYDDYYGMVLKKEQALLSERSDWYLVHELLEENNEPFYFHQFAERARRHGLQYLGDAQYSTMDTANYPQEVTTLLRELGGDLIGREQYMDFLRNRTFRQSLLVREEVVLDHDLAPEALYSFRIASQVTPLSNPPDIHSNGVEKFRGPSGTVLTTSSPVAKAAMVHLAEIWPDATPFDTLLAAAHRRLDPDRVPIHTSAHLDRERRALAEMLLRCYGLDLIELHMEAPRFVSYLSEQPIASPVARLQALTKSTITNLRHESVDLSNEVSLYLLPYLDGRHGAGEMLALVDALVEQGELVLLPDGQAPVDPGQRRALLIEALQRGMHRLLKAALLVA